MRLTEERSSSLDESKPRVGRQRLPGLGLRVLALIKPLPHDYSHEIPGPQPDPLSPPEHKVADRIAIYSIR